MDMSTKAVGRKALLSLWQVTGTEATVMERFKCFIWIHPNSPILGTLTPGKSGQRSQVQFSLMPSCKDVLYKKMALIENQGAVE